MLQRVLRTTLLLTPLLAQAQPENTSPPESFPACLAEISATAASAGVSADTRARIVPELRWREDVIALDRRQPEFTLSFSRYFGNAVTTARIERGQALAREHADLLQKLEREYGVSGHYLLAFWGLETNFGGFMGNTPSLDALATLGCDERRGRYFRAELIAALQLVDEQALQVERIRGSWAGALGLVQFMPSNYRRYGRDGDGDGRVDLFGSVPDAMTSAAHFLRELGWQPEQRWGREVRLPTGFDYRLADGREQRPLAEWARLGLRHANGGPLPVADFDAALLVPSGHRGPAFVVYQNFRVIKRWNNSDFYALAVGHLADRIRGAEGLVQSPPVETEPLRLDVVRAAQVRLNLLGFDAGEPDGVAGPGTRAAIRRFQAANNLVPDGFLDQTLLDALRADPEPDPDPDSSF